MKVVAIIQARYGSSRLSGKSMRPLAGKPMLSHVLDRAKAVRGVDAVVLATSTQVENAQLTWLADDMQIAAYRCDNEQNVLRRFVQVAVVQGADVIMRITGDCPLLAPDVCADVLAAHLAAHDDMQLTTNDVTCSGYPDGTDCEVFSRAALFAADDATRQPLGRPTADREHVTSWMRRTLPHRVVTCQSGDWSYLKLSVDSLEDFERVQRIFGYLVPGEYSLASTIAAVRRAQEMKIT